MRKELPGQVKRDEENNKFWGFCFFLDKFLVIFHIFIIICTMESDIKRAPSVPAGLPVLYLYLCLFLAPLSGSSLRYQCNTIVHLRSEHTQITQRSLQDHSEITQKSFRDHPEITPRVLQRSG